MTWSQSPQFTDVFLLGRLSQVGTKAGVIHPQTLQVEGVWMMDNKREYKGGSIENRFLRSFL